MQLTPGSASLLGQTVFVGGPFSSALRFDAQGNIVSFDEQLRATFERVYAWLRSRGMGILSSHVAERFGFDVHEATLVQRDNSWLRVCDVYLAVLPFDRSTGQPYRTDGTFVEIGLALALNRPCVLLVEEAQNPAWSYYVRNLGAETGIWIGNLADGEAGWEQVLSPAIAASAASPRLRTHIDNPEILGSLIRGASLGHTVKVSAHVLEAPALVASSRYDLCLTETRDRLAKGSARERSVAVVASDCGELALAAAIGGARSVTAIPLTDEASAALDANRQRIGPAISPLTISPAATEPYDTIVIHLFPFAGREKSFDATVHAALDVAARLWAAKSPQAQMTLLCANQAAWDLARSRLGEALAGCQYELEHMDTGLIAHVREAV